MGACLGRKSAKYRAHHRCQLDSVEISPSNGQVHQSSSETTKPCVEQQLSIVNSDYENYRISQLNEKTSVDSELEIILDQQELINQTLAQVNPSRFVSITDSELEYELANLVYGHPETDYIETPKTPIPVKPNDPQ